MRKLRVVSPLLQPAILWLFEMAPKHHIATFHFGILSVPTYHGAKRVAFKSQYALTFPFAFLQAQGIHED